MIATDLQAGIATLRDLIEGATSVVPFTGAGISTECGIPDFRSPGGIWTKMRPIPFDAFLASQEMRDEAWRRRFAMEPLPRGQSSGRRYAEYRQSAPSLRHRSGRCCGAARE
jgi:NAD-dependent deacetylase